MGKNKKIQVLILASIFIFFASTILFFGFSYRKKIEKGLLPQIILEKNSVKFYQFIKENQKYLTHPELIQSAPKELTKTTYNLFCEYFSSYLVAFPKNPITGIREVICHLSWDKEKNILGTGIACKDINLISSLNSGDYFVLGVSLNDLLERRNANYNKNITYNFCGLITPFIQDPILRTVEKNKIIKNFSEGVLVCQENLDLNQPQAFIFSGIAPSQKFQIKIYLLTKENLDKIKENDQFSEITKILDKSLMLWSK